MEHDIVFGAFIVNRRDRENQADTERGVLLEFPTDTEMVKQTFKTLGLLETAGSDDYIIDCGECSNDNLKKLLSRSESIDELNYLANRIAELEDTEAVVFETALEIYGECNNVRDAINLTYNTECYDIIADMSCWENVGAYFAEQAGFSVGVIGDLADYIDYEAYGKDLAYKNGGELVDDIYIESGCADWTEVYDGNEMNIPREYAVTLRLAAELEQIPQKDIKDLIDTEKTKTNTITVLIVQPAQEPYTKEIGADLKSLQQVVGGNIEVIYPFADEVGIICNDEGKNERLELNRALYDAEGEIYDIIAGTFFVAGIDSENFCSLSPEQIKTYSERFKSPEMFIQVNDNIKAIPVKPSIKRELKKLSNERSEPEPKQKQKKPPNTELSEP